MQQNPLCIKVKILGIAKESLLTMDEKKERKKNSKS